MASIEARVMAIIGGVLLIILGIGMAEPIIAVANTSVAYSNISSILGSQFVAGITPLIWYATVVIAGTFAIAVGVLGFAGKGPLS